ncbi:hypothetical protein SF1_12190 [Sphingobacterium faecium NBRC 15299]|nr:hypothetical protein SF1_12190 [Sphingobacterium faecium NBRC 15299]
MSPYPQTTSFKCQTNGKKGFYFFIKILINTPYKTTINQYKRNNIALIINTIIDNN